MKSERSSSEIQKPLLEGDGQNGAFSLAIPDGKYLPRRLADADSRDASPSDQSLEHGGSSILRTAVPAVVLYFIIGTMFFYTEGTALLGVKTQPVIDALYLCVVTLTTVGYGDLVPASTHAKLFTCAYVFVGFGLVGVLLSGAANYFVGKQEQILEKAYLKRKRKLQNVEYNPEDDDVRSAHWKAVISGLMILVLIFMGVIFLVKYEKMSMVDAVYCVSITITTLGYGDRSFSTATGRLFAVIWILASTICAAQFFLFLTEINTERRQQRLARLVLKRKPTRRDLEAADVDQDHILSAPEFVIMKLKELGRIDEEDVTGILQHYRHLVHNPSDCVNIHESNLAQPS